MEKWIRLARRPKGRVHILGIHSTLVPTALKIFLRLGDKFIEAKNATSIRAFYKAWDPLELRLKRRLFLAPIDNNNEAPVKFNDSMFKTLLRKHGPRSAWQPREKDLPINLLSQPSMAKGLFFSRIQSSMQFFS